MKRQSVNKIMLLSHRSG